METDNKMGQEPINKLILQMSMPPLFSMFLQYSYNLVDSMFVAKINEQALAAVSLSFPITTLMNALSIWLGVGVNVRIASYLGQKRQEKADRVATLGLIVSVILGICVNLFVLAIMKPYYRAFTNDAQIFSYGMTYMQICAFMQIPNMVHILIQKELQATGNMLAPMWFQIAGVVFNFIFDPLLIFGIGPFPKMGIAGAALATVLGYTLSMLIALVMILFTKQKVRLTAVAFFGAYFKVQQLIVMTVNGLIQGCLPIMSFNYGAGKKDRLQQSYRSGRKIATCMMAVGTLLVLVFPNQILALFSASKAMREFGIPAMRIMAIGFIFSGISTMAATYAQATNKLIQSIVIQLLRQAVLLLPVMWICNLLFHIWGIWIAFPITEIVVMIVSILIVKSDKISR